MKGEANQEPTFKKKKKARSVQRSWDTRSYLLQAAMASSA